MVLVKLTRMQKIFGFDPRTRLLYFGAIVVLALGGILLVVAGVGGIFMADRVREQNSAYGVLIMGVLMLLGAGAPFHGWRRGGRSRIIVTQDELIYEDDGVPRSIAWTDIEDLSDMSTYVTLGLRDKQGSLTLPNSFESFPELVAEIRQRARIRSDWT